MMMMMMMIGLLSQNWYQTVRTLPVEVMMLYSPLDSELLLSLMSLQEG